MCEAFDLRQNNNICVEETIEGFPRMNAHELLRKSLTIAARPVSPRSTFGRRAVNDGKLTSRLRNGGRITTETLDRIRTFMTIHNGREMRVP